ncbi:extensin family protein [Streptomyces sp. NBC_00094]|uniref:extensin family protein n=1 Tax=Streptomyces sp. NBC_00094 TaxID=2903620 RepID=UPI002259A5B0|nr:extensin family protein [Streptomyces sp. NBC_00094]MCX5394788.1 extensin family protein [Streptomyces sp. NBC_00094]
MSYETLSSAGSSAGPLVGEFERGTGFSPWELVRVVSAVAQGTRDENALTSLLFHQRHPERAGAVIRRDERGAAAEWLAIRDTVVRPLLGGGRAPAPAGRPSRRKPCAPGAPPATPLTPRPTRSCAAPGGVARVNCKRPGTMACPAVTGLLCAEAVDGVPFHYPECVRTVPGSGPLLVVARRQWRREQRFTGPFQDTLSTFLRNMRGFGMPVEAILTVGSHYCRCVERDDPAKPDILSNHSYGDALDIAGVRWPEVGGPPSAVRDTIVDNWTDPGQRVLLRRIDACLRLSFATVIDYYRDDHRDHFHCDTNRGQASNPLTTVRLGFTREALRAVGHPVTPTGHPDADALRALAAFSGVPVASLKGAELQRVLRALFTRVAAGR